MPAANDAALPQPSLAARQHSAQVTAEIVAEVEASDDYISFERFMTLALYAPALGYYSSGSHKLGRGGDFTTAPEISPLFSQALARQAAEVLQQLGGGDILEFGGGSGVMAAEILLELERLQQLPQRYLLLEVSADLQQRQRQRLEQSCPHLRSRVEWLEQLPSPGFRGVVLANELLDALPFSRIYQLRDGWIELGVEVMEGTLWEAARLLTPDEPLSVAINNIAALQQLPSGYSTEISLQAADWVRTLPTFIDRATILIIDYGFPQAEFYHPQRSSGTMMCHYQHRAHSDPFFYPGLQDITAHVDFTAVADAALEVGMEVRGFTPQGQFLLGAGIVEHLSASLSPQQQMAQNHALKLLTLPAEMGELFKVMALGCHHPFTPSAFSLLDHRHRL
ncbi:MAG: SAM-dependent methyltransferase [Gammaproteobacteria bacterium]|nr:SAM-dependent methyltransferase [Gammaproteobacteria bacterium]